MVPKNQNPGSGESDDGSSEPESWTKTKLSWSQKTVILDKEKVFVVPKNTIREIRATIMDQEKIIMVSENNNPGSAES